MDSSAGDVQSIKLRSYQEEMLDSCLKHNVIIVMDTGSGKTYIAVRRIAEELKSTRKIVWFMCPSVALCMQQYQVLAEQLPRYLIKTLTGSDGVDRWTTQPLWDGFLKNVRVVVCTPKVLEDALTHGFVKIPNISLLVFDEAHRCIKDAPMNVIMRDFYHPTKTKGTEDLPNVLGLTASPVMSAKSSSLETIEANLDAKAITPKIHRTELERYVHPPQVIRVNFVQSQEGGQYSYVCQALKHILCSYDTSTEPLRCYKQLKALHQRANALNEQLGRSAAEWYINTCAQKYIQLEVYQSELFIEDSEREKMHLQKILVKIQTDTKGHADTATEPVDVTDKVKALVRLLDATWSPNVRGLIFVEQRAVVAALASLLREKALTSSTWSIGAFVGTSSFANRKANLADLAEFKEQTQDLEDFYRGKKNLMITTSVLEEGIDVSACNLVVCFDLPKNLVSFVQRRGRARREDSQYILFISEQDSNPSKWNRLEAEMKQAYMDDIRDQGIADVVEDDDDSSSEREYRIKTTDALLTHSNAKAHLYHFCAVSSLHASRHVDLRPQFAPRNNGGKTPWSATVVLPSFVHPSVRTASSSKPYSSEARAIKDASFEAYVALHREGLVNDNLLPLREDPQFTFIDQPSIIEISEPQSGWKQLLTHRATTRWNAASLRISHDDHLLISVAMWLPESVPAIESFNLYWNEDITYTVHIETYNSEVLLYAGSELESIRIFTRTILESIYKIHMTDACDFPVLFSPLNDEDGVETSIENALGGAKNPKDDQLGPLPEPTACGLVRVRSQENKAYLFRGVKRPQAGAETEVEVTAFPKRKDFLHPLDQTNTRNAAYSATYSFPSSDCKFDRLPARYAMVAAFVPSIMHKLDGVFLAQDLQSTALRDIHINDLSLLKEAISSPSAGEKADYNRLEFLGDSILKFCASLQIIAQHLNWPEGYLSKGKYVIVSNNFLTKAALDVGLDRFVLTEKFTGRKWRPPTIDALLTAEDGGSRRLSSKVVADVVEALIGAAYVDGGLPKAFTCIRELLPGQQWFSHSEATDRLLSDVTPIGRLDLQLLERLVGHDFMHKSLLLEAVTHASSSSNPTVPSYERLEFLGDAILDLIIVPKIFAHNNRLRHWELARVHSALVAGDFLGYCCMSYGIGEETQNVVVEVSDQGKHLPLLRSATRRVHLYDFLQAGPQLLGHKLNSLEAFQKHHGAVDEALECGKDYPWPDLIAMRPQKFFSDLIESVLGALFLDTQGDLAVCEAFVEKLGIFKIMRRILDERVETASPKERVGILAGEKSVEYIATQTESGEERFGCACTVVVDGEEVAHAEECSSKDEAKARAAFEAVKILQARLEEEVKLEGGGSRKKRKLELRPVETEQPALQLDDVDMDVDGGAVLLADDKDD